MTELEQIKIAIRNYVAGSFLLEQEQNRWDAIVILDSRTKETSFVAEHSRRHAFLRFDDVTGNRHDKRPPTSEDVKSAISFADGSDNLLVCCRAGQSRSAAIAFSICYVKHGADAACQLLDPKRHAPNRLIIELAAQALNSSDLLHAFEHWHSRNRHINLADYVDDIERELDGLEEQGARNRIVR